MKLTSTFLGTKGLSQSEANHISNVVKEIAEQHGAEIQYMSTHKKTLMDQFGSHPYNNVRVVPDLESKCLQEGSLYALSAWLREGIKAKAKMIQEIQAANPKDLGFEMPEAPRIGEQTAMPVESEMIQELSIAELAEYLECEAKAAHIGKKIHPGGIIPRWRKQLQEQPPVEMIQGEKAYLRINVEEIIKPEVVDELFYKMQREHREAESRVNYYKAKLHNLFNERLVAAHSANRLLLDEYRSKMADHAIQSQSILTRAEAWRAEKLKEVSDFKIVVPESLQPLLDTILKVAKK